MFDFFIGLVILLIGNFALYTVLSKILLRSLIANQTKLWIVSVVAVGFLVPIACRIFHQSHNLAFYFCVFYLVLINGYSSNYKLDEEVYSQVEEVQKKALRYSIFATVLSYLLSFSELHQ